MVIFSLKPGDQVSVARLGAGWQLLQSFWLALYVYVALADYVAGAIIIGLTMNGSIPKTRSRPTPLGNFVRMHLRRFNFYRAH